MTFYLSQSFIFEAAHTLHRTVPLKEFQGSQRIHGHTYSAEVTIAGERGASGMLQVKAPGKRIKFVRVDLFYLREAIEAVRKKLDHHFLDEVDGIGPATLENLCVFIAAEVGKKFPVHSVQVSRQAGDKCLMVMTNPPKATP